ncbi:NAD kinase 2, chloroplastic-like [Nicotiana sylvestris]|nr:PREDICTED: NAD kinase 2, chloroplastic-like isoform X2 [Nicotiana tabacum]XP_016515769.1 PREDICTED: NAD kinase 2, chloroplastic-like isoform X2 [Nicotiana tabacum]XP_016515771.1 PREDICTED: NAD kinase 2, chloroplastic-like isoform X2 [Nicotiana tabacum]XP_016515774.1 PREDICTED: NAD kinase 2, chloroplastic-like isoform X2 [Nicotiana tabacum]
MAICFRYFPCHLEMGLTVAATGTHLHYCQLNYAKAISGPGFGLRLSYGYRRVKFVVSAELSNAFSVNIDLDSQAGDTSQLPRMGPLPGDIAEIEAYCRIFRAAEQLHNSLMDTLCNPLTGECNVSYDVPSDDKQILEDKLVSVLGCMVCLLNKGREEVLSGRSSITDSFRDVDVHVTDDELPPLAIFRGEMKRYCESLHVALENYLTPDDPRSIIVWQKLQRLKNVCYDAGFPRGEKKPSHTLFANFSPVYLSTSNEETQSTTSEVAFWRGGQVTDEGLRWLLERGFKTIVDLRAETVKDIFYEKVLDEAISSGEIELIELPVEVGISPSVEQVEKFAALVSDLNKKPLYLHSREGIKRTSAMVSRWRQYITRYTPQVVASTYKTADSTGNSSRDARGTEETFMLPRSEEGTSFNDEVSSASDNQDGSLPKRSDDINSDVKDIKHISETTGLGKTEGDEVVSSNRKSTVLESDSEVAPYINVNPLKSQLPPSNVFSRKEMSAYFRSRMVSPATYFTHERKRLEVLSASRYSYKGVPKGNETTSIYSENGVMESQNLNGSSLNKHLTTNPSTSSSNTEMYAGHSDSATPVLNGISNGEVQTSIKKVGIVDARDEIERTAESRVTTGERRNIEVSTPLLEDNLEQIEGNMCASATGVVRVQSRRKAEMFLVRTDGYSCTREKVTESSLAFTHPSTQQQMLLWKSTPKTVLLLKKLGYELMEEAKEVASFLYSQEKMTVLVEPEVHDIFARIPGFGFVQTFYSQDTSDLHERVDFVACLGGDGVILHASNIFRGAVPPVISFNLGSLGFLTSHPFEDYKKDLRQVIHGNNTLDGVYITLRMRLQCEIFRSGKAMPGKVFDVLNEIVVDRGSNPYLSKIECYEHDRLITKVQGDGVIVATPTGSTAYSTAAGGSMVHPNVPCMLFTPICPHSLSFRPVILPDSARLELKIPEDARSNAWVSFDGKRRQQLSRGDSVRIYMSQHPLPTVNKSDQTGDWFRSLIRCLNWNERLDQKAL